MTNSFRISPRMLAVLACGLMLGSAALPALADHHNESADVPHIVFVTGDEEYRSEESMPMLARILARDYGFKTTICYSLNDEGTIDPNNTKSITGMEALDDADLMVLFTRFRDLPAEQMAHFLKYVDSGKPVVGFRTATHAFKFEQGSPYQDWNYKKIAELVGQHWITHHGHHGHDPLTAVSIIDEAKQHPILRGVEPFRGYSWLYHVHGGEHRLHGDSAPLLLGKTLQSSHVNNPQYPPTTPVAWTKSYQGKDGRRGRVFFTTLGHPYDFKEVAMRRLGLQGILWALGRENEIPAAGVPTKTVVPFQPNNAGFGKLFKAGVKPDERNAGTK